MRLADLLYGQTWSVSSATYLYTINPADGTTNEVGSGGFVYPPLGGVTSVAFQPKTGVLYGFVNCASFSSLYEIDPSTGGISQVGPATGLVSTYQLSIAFDPLTGVLYGMAGDDLYTINTTTGAVNYVASTTAPVNSIAFDATTGVLYGENNDGVSTSNLYTINTGTGAMSQVGSGNGLVWCIAVNPTTGVLYGESGGLDTTTLYTINKTTGALNEVGIGNGNGAAPISSIAFYSLTARWGVAQGDWSQSAFWSNALPTSLGDVYVTNGGAVRITLPGGMSATISIWAIRTARTAARSKCPAAACR